MRYYLSDIGGGTLPGDNCPSGAYIFKPAQNQMTSLRYADLTSIKSFRGSIV